MQYKTWLHEWLELYVKNSAKAQTYEKYSGITKKYLLPAFGEREVEGLAAGQLQQFTVSLTGRGLSPNTVTGVLAVLKASLKKAVALGVAKRQYTDAIVRPRQREKKITAFTKPEQRKIEEYVLCHSGTNLCGILISLYTGLRIGELLALTWEDVDLRKGTLSVTKSCYDSWENGKYRKVIGTTKTLSSERVIPLPRQLVSYLREVKRRGRGKYVIPGKSSDGAQIRSYQRTFSNLLEKLGLPHRGFHALRHTFATRALEVGMDVKTLSEILGHKNPMVTLRRYAHSLLEHKSEMMNKLGKLLE